MIIKLSPQRRDDTLEVYKDGDKLTINGIDYDFSQLQEGETLPSDAIDNEFFVDKIERIDGTLHITLILPHEADAPYEKRFPEPLISPPNGRIV